MSKVSVEKCKKLWKFSDFNANEPNKTVANLAQTALKNCIARQSLNVLSERALAKMIFLAGLKQKSCHV